MIDSEDELLTYKQLFKDVTIYYKEYSFLLFLSISISVICRLMYNHFSTKHTISHKVILPTKTKVYDFKTPETCHSQTNAVYLTNIHYEGYMAIFAHIIYGYLKYFNNPINIFCLIVTIGQLYDYVDPRSLYPLSIIATYMTGKHVFDMWKRLKEQNSINQKSIIKYNHKKGLLENGDHIDVYINKTTRQGSLKRGDFIKLGDGNEIPADILLINSTVKVQEYELTGEDNIILKSGLKTPNDSVSKSNGQITINHHKNNGMIEIDNHKYPYTKDNMILRGTQIVDGEAFGIIIECGNDCQIYHIDNTRTKPPTQIQKEIIDICFNIFGLMLILASTTGLIIWSIHKDLDPYYSRKELWPIIRRMILFFNMVIPLSLQFFSESGSSELSSRLEKDLKITVNRNGTMAFQTNPQFIVSDKTGTITTGEIQLNAVYITQASGDFVNILEAKHQTVDILPNILACTETQSHSRTRMLLKNDIVEEKLLSYFFSKYQWSLSKNDIDPSGQGTIAVNGQWHDRSFERLYYKPFDYQLEVKIAVIKEQIADVADQRLMLHIQGTPEAVNTYSSSKLDPILEMLETRKTPSNVYKRLIAHAYKQISEDDLKVLKKNPSEILKNMEQAAIYVFYDYVIDEIKENINVWLEKGHDFTMLTGDKMSSSLEIGQTIGVINDEKYLIIDKIEDIDKAIVCPDDSCYLINGRLLETLINSDEASRLSYLISQSKKRIIYRASPCSKQLYVSFLKTWFNKEVMMIGDGSNDIAALMEADIGIAIKKTNNNNVQSISDIVVDSIIKVTPFLEKSTVYRSLIRNVNQLVLSKHIMTASQLLLILLISKFEITKDPATADLMAILNVYMFICTQIYCKYTNKAYQSQFLSMIGMAVFWSLVNVYVVFHMVGMSDMDLAIKLMVTLQAIELTCQLVYFYRH